MQDLNDKITGGTLSATEWNEVPSEIQNLIEASGQVLSSGDLTQLRKATALIVTNIASMRTIAAGMGTVFLNSHTDDGDEGYGKFYWDSASTETDNNGTIVKLTAVTTGRYKRLYSGFVNVKWFGAKADGATDDSVAITAADSLATSEGIQLIFPRTTTSYRCKELRWKENGTNWIGEGGRVKLQYNGTGAENGQVIRADKVLDHSSQNYKDVVLNGFIIDGNDTALYGIKTNGFTRRCVLKNVDIRQCVCPMLAEDGFYSAYENCEFEETPPSMPSGMTVGLYNAALYGTNLVTCHAATFRNCKWYQIGGNSSNSYIAALRVQDSNSVSFDAGCTWEEMKEVAHGRYVDDVIFIDNPSTVSIENSYIENLQASNSIIKVAQNATLAMNDTFFALIEAASLFNIHPDSPVTLNNTHGRDIDLTDRLFKALSGSILYRLTLTGNTTFAAGPLSGAIYDSNATVNSKKGLWSDAILLDDAVVGSETGHGIQGYSVSISTDYILVTPGTRKINGQIVNFGIDVNTDQRLTPDLSIVDTWNVKISPAGTPYVENQGAVESGSAYAPTIATFTTPGSGGAPTGLVLLESAKQRLNGIIEHPLTSDILINKVLSGSVDLPDTGTATVVSLLDLVLDVAAGADSFTAEIKYHIYTTQGATRSTERGTVTVSFNQDNASGRVIAFTKEDFTQAKDAGMASWTVTFSATSAGHIGTLKVASETSANVTSKIFFEAHIIGGTVAASSVNLASGVTEAI